MKTILILMMAVGCMFFSFAQQNKIDLRDAYLQRSYNQKLGALITLGCGTAALIPGVVLFGQAHGQGLDHLEKGLKGTGLIILGVGCIGASVIQFINSNRNLKRANRLTLDINKPVVIDMGLDTRTLPYSVGVNIPIN
jgi:hypothetical protein